jgi:hypothetical protein
LARLSIVDKNCSPVSLEFIIPKFAKRDYANRMHSPGLRGGDAIDQKSPPARFSVKTSPSHPALTPSKAKDALTGVGSIMSQLEGGLEKVLEVDDKGGVVGMWQSVSKDRIAAAFSGRTKASF